MKDKFITREHFNYANKILKYLGFKSMCDFDTDIVYSELKKLEEEICNQVTSTMDKFKELFPLNEFDLRRIKYKFENIDQVIGFFKKLATYLSIPYEFVRIKKSVIMRLARSKSFLYNNYIQDMEMRENPQVVAFTATPTPTPSDKETKPQYEAIPQMQQMLPRTIINSSEILKYKMVKSFEKEYIVGPIFELGLFIDFMWINWIKIAFYTNGQIVQLSNLSCVIEFFLGLHHVQTLDVNNSSDFDSNGFFTIPIDIFNNHFYRYHNGQIKIKINNQIKDFWMFKIIVNGNNFTDKMPAKYLDGNSLIECNHDSKYYMENLNFNKPYTWRITSGMIGPNFAERPVLSELINFDLVKTKFDEYISNGNVQINDSVIILNKSLDDKIDTIYYWKYLSSNSLYDKYICFQTNEIIKLKYSHISQENSTSSIYYPIDYETKFFKNMLVEYYVEKFEIKFIDIITNLTDGSNYSKINNLINKDLPYIKLNTQSENIYKYLEIELLTNIKFIKK